MSPKWPKALYPLNIHPVISNFENRSPKISYFNKCGGHVGFMQFGALYIHNHDDKYSARPGFEPGTSRLQTPVDTNETSGSAC